MIKSTTFKIKYLLLIFSLALIIVTLKILTNLYLAAPEAKLSNYLSPPTTDSVWLTPWNGSIKHFWLATIIDPILALPGTDISELKIATKKLRAGQSLFLSYYSQEEQALIAEHLHPYEFLESLPIVEESRREFIAKPTILNALKYNYQLYRSLGLLELYTKKLSDLFFSFTPKQDIWFFAGITNEKQISRQLEQAHLEITAQRQMVRSRTLCLLGLKFDNNCLDSFPPIIIPNTSVAAESTEKNLGYKLDLTAYFQNSKTGHFSLTDTAAQSLPLVYLAQSACTLDKSATYLFTWKNSRVSDRPFLWTTPTSELIFHDVSQRKNAIDSALADVGVTYEFQPLNPYMCVDNSIDVSKIRTAYYLQNQLEISPLFLKAQYASSSKIITDLRALERSLVESKAILGTDIIEEYIATSQVLIYSNQQKNLEIMAPEDILRLLEIISTWRAQSAWLESEISKIDDMAITTSYVLKTVKIKLRELITTRGYFSTTILSSNQTLYEHPIIFLSERKPMDLKEAGLVDYQTTLSKVLSQEELAEFINVQGDMGETVYTH